MRKLLILIALLLPLSATAQSLVVHGTVTDQATGEGLPGANVVVEGTTNRTSSDADGTYVLRFASSERPKRLTLLFSFVGFNNLTMKDVPVPAGVDSLRIDAALSKGQVLQDVVVESARPLVARDVTSSMRMSAGIVGNSPPPPGDGYAHFTDNGYRAVANAPLSTFSIDVDRASYANMRRFLLNGNVPPADAIRVEELINYFPYDVPEPEGQHPFSLVTETMPAPWQPAHRLVRITLQAERVETDDLPPSNLVFLLDVSGSMGQPDKLPLLQAAMRLLVNELRPQDRVAIAVYAGNAGLVLPPTSGSDKTAILEAIERLEAGGSTAGGAGIQLAYAVAQEHFMREGNNRVILATDGDFNVGVSDVGGLERLIEIKRETGIFLTVLGFGEGNLQDQKMETLADKGNGQYHYIDNLLEARKALVEEMGGTLLTVAKDVKLQIEFNPAHAQAYRLIGYENRLLNDEDFEDDTKDAGEMGAGHTVTALYEVVPVGAASPVNLPPLRYQDRRPRSGAASDELCYVRLRYKKPDSRQSTELGQPVRMDDARPSSDFQFAAAVATFGMILRDSPHKGSATLSQAQTLARAGLGFDPGGYRAEFLRLMDAYRGLLPATASMED